MFEIFNPLSHQGLITRAIGDDTVHPSILWNVLAAAAVYKNRVVWRVAMLQAVGGVEWR